MPKKPRRLPFSPSSGWILLSWLKCAREQLLEFLDLVVAAVPGHRGTRTSEIFVQAVVSAMSLGLLHLVLSRLIPLPWWSDSKSDLFLFISSFVIQIRFICAWRLRFLIIAVLKIFGHPPVFASYLVNYFLEALLEPFIKPDSFVVSHLRSCDG